LPGFISKVPGVVWIDVELGCILGKGKRGLRVSLAPNLSSLYVSIAG
jgi:hypothetical protein